MRQWQDLTRAGTEKYKKKRKDLRYKGECKYWLHNQVQRWVIQFFLGNRLPTPFSSLVNTVVIVRTE